jgi:hypothetical protein
VARFGRLLLLGLIALSPVPVRPAGARAAPAIVAPPRVTLGDSDGDGLPEASVSGVVGGPCACRCPVAGADADARAADQVVSAGAATALVVCGTRIAAVLDPGAPGGGSPRADGRLRLDPGGLGRGGPSG